MAAGVSIGEAPKGKECRIEQPGSSAHVFGSCDCREESAFVLKGNGDSGGRAMQGNDKDCKVA